MPDSPTKRGRGRPKTFDRDHALNVAMESYWRDGVDGVSLNEICRRAGLSKPAFYREFGNEDDLKTEALNHYLTTVRASASETLRPETSFSQALASIIATLTNPDGDGGPSCLLVKMQNQRDRLGERVGARVDELVDQTRNTYSQLITDAIERGEIELDVPVEVATDYLEGQLNYLTRLAEDKGLEAVDTHAKLAFAVFGYDGER